MLQALVMLRGRNAPLAGSTRGKPVYYSAAVCPTRVMALVLPRSQGMLDSTLRGGQLEWRSYDPVRTVVADSNAEQGRIQERDKATNGPLDGHEGPRLYGNRNQQRRLCSAPAVLHTLLRSHSNLHLLNGWPPVVGQLVHFYRFHKT